MADRGQSAREGETLRTLVVGLGNRLCGDDAAGLDVARLVAARAPKVDSIELEREPSDLLGLWPGYEAAIVIDAVVGGEPGRIHRFDGGQGLTASFRAGHSTHSLGLAEVIELARELDRLPDRVTVVGIEGSRFALGATMSAAVGTAVETVAAAVLAELGRERGVGHGETVAR